MPVQTTYPGVYIQEIASGVRAITGVATSVTAFVGRALRGPVGTPITINSNSDFERMFGGLWVGGSMGYSVRDFYLNGGSQGVIVRLYHPYFATDADRLAALATAQDVATAANNAANTTPAAVLTAATIQAALPANASPAVRKAAGDAIVAAVTAAVAANPVPPATVAAATAAVKAAASAAVGVAAPITRARFTVKTSDASNSLNLEAASEGGWGNLIRIRIDNDVKGPDAATLFNLYAKDTATGVVEVFRNVSVQLGAARRIDNVLVQSSQLLRVRGAFTTALPSPTATPTAGADPWGDSTTIQADVTGRASDGSDLTEGDYVASEANKAGIYALAGADLFNLLVIPPMSFTADVTAPTWAAAAAYCGKRRAMLLIDSPSSWVSKDNARDKLDSDIGVSSANAAIFFPRLMESNPLHDSQIEAFAASGAVAGVIARTDTNRGVWKAPAGLDATMVGVPGLSVPLTDAENGELNPLGINCLRSMPPAGRIIWGSRTLRGDDRLADQWKYLPVRRTALFIEESLYRGTQWVVFEPNDEPLWAQIRLNVGAFMHGLFRQGAFQGKTPRDAYFVKCDGETTTQSDIDLGIVNIVVGFAPLKPAEFVVIQLQQLAGQIAT
jgi:phage tail sheath protein FI